VASRRIESAREAAGLAGCAFATTDAAAACRRADAVVLSVPDDAVEAVCARVAAQGGFRPGSLVLHLSGVLGSQALAPAAALGANTLAFHPVQTFARPDPRLFEGIACVLEGDPEAVALGAELVRWLGARPVEVRAADKPLYHAALCVACNYMVTLADAASGLLAQAGIAEDALPLLLPLLEGTLDNLRGVGLPDALTGPISRGDVATLRAHLEALANRAPSLLPLYCTLGLHTLALALRKGTITDDQAGAIRELFGARNGMDGSGGRE
jgi:predicted short-subunit dehydrogenase-like oxidoreductase (DUF2520 family)